jgi:hypothetical protein
MTLFIFQYGGRRANQLRVQHGIPQHPVKGEPKVLIFSQNIYCIGIHLNIFHIVL